MTSERGANSPETTSGQDLATIGSRFVAVFIDWVASLIFVYLLGWAGIGTADPFADNLMVAGLFALYYTFVLAFGTQTLGMAAMRIACVSASTGGRLGFWRSLVRSLLLSLLLPALTALAHPYNRGLHDLAAGSVMLKVPAKTWKP
ncbi:MAG TPA: RDD family protein [Glycomyces sp.]|nr:RDD family protein [Glycomyces sp.]